ncbi:MAG: hypothetical protein ACREIP_02385, partial [Alphaproteobacteria bacterium]
GCGSSTGGSFASGGGRNYCKVFDDSGQALYVQFLGLQKIPTEPVPVPAAVPPPPPPPPTKPDNTPPPPPPPPPPGPVISPKPPSIPTLPPPLPPETPSGAPKGASVPTPPPPLPILPSTVPSGTKKP